MLVMMCPNSCRIKWQDEIQTRSTLDVRPSSLYSSVFRSVRKTGSIKQREWGVYSLCHGFFTPDVKKVKKNIQQGAPGWLCWLSIRLLVSAQVVISSFMSSSPASGSDGVEPAWDSLSPSLSLPAPPLLALSVSLKINQ